MAINKRVMKYPGPPIAPRGWRWIRLNEPLKTGDMCRNLSGAWFQIKLPKLTTTAATAATGAKLLSSKTFPLTPYLYIRPKPRKIKSTTAH